MSAIIASGIVPAAIEMMDRLAIEAAKAATGLDWPDVGAALLMDVDGPRGRGRAHRRRTRSSSRARPARSRSGVPRDEAERRSCGRGARARSPPSAGSARTTSCRTASSRARRSRGCCARSTSSRTSAGLRVANVFHAGDGNLHPLVLYDAHDPRAGARRRGARRRDPADLHRATAARSPASTASAPTRPPYMAEMFSRGGPRDDGAACAARSIPDAGSTRARSSRRRGCAATGPGRYRPHPTELAGRGGSRMSAPRAAARRRRRRDPRRRARERLRAGDASTRPPRSSRDCGARRARARLRRRRHGASSSARRPSALDVVLRHRAARRASSSTRRSDQIVVVEAGVTLARAAGHARAAHGQRLALDPPLARARDDRRHRRDERVRPAARRATARVRDLIIGISFVRADGDARARRRQGRQERRRASTCRS